MKNFILCCLFIPFLAFSQSKRDLKKYDKIVELIESNNLEEAKSQTLELIDRTKGWRKSHLLMFTIYKKQGKILESIDEYLKVYDLESKSSAYPISILSQLLYEYGYYQEALKYFMISENLFGVENYHQRFILNCQFAINAINYPVPFSPKNLGESINSVYSEYLPNISANGRELIITRKVKGKNNKIQEDLFFSKNTDDIWSVSHPMSINTDLNEGAVTVSADKRFLIYTACEREDGFGSCDLYICVKDENGYWSNAMNLGAKINTKYWESQASFSPDGKYLYFVSNRRGGFGGDDIWRSEITRFGFSNPVNLGEIINTPYNEMSPFIHQDNLTFYFASDGHVGMGDFDLFVSRRNNTDTSWNIPENLGYPINSHKTENSLVVGPDGKTAYFTSNHSGFGLEDIFFFYLPIEHRANVISNLELEVITEEKGSEIILQNVHFETNSYILKESSFNELNILSNYLQKNPSVKIHIQGHTDDIGEIEYNQNLSENRAETVYNYLLMKGISEDRLSYKGYGEISPIANNNNTEGRQLNRRTSFVIVP